MRDLLVILSIGHSGRPDVPRGVGASHDGVHELDLVRRYAHICEIALRGWGVACWPISDGTLQQRQQRAVEYGTGWLRERPTGLVLYVACHVNSAPGDYGLVLHDERSRLGAQVAKAIQGPLSRFEELSRVLVRATPGETPERPWRNAHATIRHIFDGPNAMAAVCFEPFFIDQPAHKPLTWSGGLNQVGLALAEGLLSAARSLEVK